MAGIHPDLSKAIFTVDEVNCACYHGLLVVLSEKRDHAEGLRRQLGCCQRVAGSWREGEPCLCAWCQLFKDKITPMHNVYCCHTAHHYLLDVTAQLPDALLAV